MIKKPKRKDYQFGEAFIVATQQYIDQLEAENKELKADAKLFRKFKHLGAPELLNQISALNNRNKELKEKIKRVEDIVDKFDNHSDCYADTRSVNLIGEDIEGDVVTAMTKDRLRDLTLKALEG